MLTTMKRRRRSSSSGHHLCSLEARPRVLHHLVRREHVIPDLLPEGGLYLVTCGEQIDMAVQYDVS